MLRRLKNTLKNIQLFDLSNLNYFSVILNNATISLQRLHNYRNKTLNEKEKILKKNVYIERTVFSINIEQYHYKKNTLYILTVDRIRKFYFYNFFLYLKT